MNNLFCRYMKCNMSFFNENHRKQHEGLMHRDMLRESAVLLLDKIHKTNSEENLQKKVLKTSFGNISYKEAKERAQEESEQGRIIMRVLENIVESYFKQYPDHGMEQMIRVSEFKIK